MKEEYEEKAEAVLQKVKGEHMKRLGEKKSKKKKKKGKKKKKDNSDDGLVFVGIHCRRTDYLAYQERYKRALLTPAYYLDAMHLFRDEFGTGRVAFVFVSDDMEWGRQKLMMRNKEVRKRLSLFVIVIVVAFPVAALVVAAAAAVFVLLLLLAAASAVPATITTVALFFAVVVAAAAFDDLLQQQLLLLLLLGSLAYTDGTFFIRGTFTSRATGEWIPRTEWEPTLPFCHSATTPFSPTGHSPTSPAL